MNKLEFSSPYINIEEYDEFTSAYISADRLLGLEYEEMEISSVNEYLLTINDEYEGTLFDASQSMYDLFEVFTGMRASIIVNPTPSTAEYCGVGIMQEKKKTVDELFKEEYEACEATDISQVQIDEFIHYCEELYKMKTNYFLEWFEKRNYEGNIDMQMWALYARNQKSRGADD